MFLALRPVESVSLVCYARASGHVADFGTRGGLLSQGLPGQGYQCRRLHRAFSGFYFIIFALSPFYFLIYMLLEMMH